MLSVSMPDGSFFDGPEAAEGLGSILTERGFKGNVQLEYGTGKIRILTQISRVLELSRILTASGFSVSEEGMYGSVFDIQPKDVYSRLRRETDALRMRVAPKPAENRAPAMRKHPAL